MATGRGRRRGKRTGDFTDGLMPDRMHAATEAMSFIDSYKLMECLGGMHLDLSRCTKVCNLLRTVRVVIQPESSGWVE